MPIYEYQCTKCGHDLEVMQKISDKPLTRCPNCEEDALKKLVSASSFRLKGGGWYETDFKQGNKKRLADSDSVDSDKAKTDKGPGTATVDSSGTDKIASKKSSSTDAGTSD